MKILIDFNLNLIKLYSLKLSTFTNPKSVYHIKTKPSGLHFINDFQCYIKAKVKLIGSLIGYVSIIDNSNCLPACQH